MVEYRMGTECDSVHGNIALGARRVRDEDMHPPVGRALVDRVKRAEEMIRLRAAGATLAAIASRFNVSRERVRQILRQPPGRPVPASPPPTPTLSDRAVRSLFLGLDELPLTVRSYSVLKRLGAVRLGDVVSVPLPVLRKVKGIGRVTVEDLQACCSLYDLRLGLGSLPWPPRIPEGQRHRIFGFYGSELETGLLDARALRRLLRLPES
jgi:hypothetical protein